MKNARDTQLSDRRGAAAEAKAAQLEAYRAARIAADASEPQRQAERAAVTAAREERRIERDRLKQEEQERTERETAERQAAEYAAANAEAEARQKAEDARVASVIEGEAARKAARDLRYANRKARNA